MKRQYLKVIRKELGITIEDVAYSIDVSYNYILNIENGHQGDKASFLLMGKIAKAYQITIEELYQLESEYQLQKGGG
jgi:DNA-binding XRE family transcriptional regulator